MFVDGEGLHIFPTLTTETTSITEAEIVNGYTLNLTESGGDGSCTSDAIEACSVRSNATLGTIINPVRSARLNTKGRKSILYGRVEVEAKLPRGDWLWPAICKIIIISTSTGELLLIYFSLGMMPERSTYGEWPASGEIDIMESRGNDVDYPMGGRDISSSSIHWGKYLF